MATNSFPAYWDQPRDNAPSPRTSNLDDTAKVSLLQNLNQASHSPFVNYILSRLPKDIQFDQTVSLLKKILGTPTSVFNKRFLFPQLVKNEAHDIVSYDGKVNSARKEFEFEKVNIDYFKCLIFVCGLRIPRYAVVQARLFTRIPEGETADTPVTFPTRIDEFQRLVNLKANPTLIEKQSGSRHVDHEVSEKEEHQSHRPPKEKGKSLTSIPCCNAVSSVTLRLPTIAAIHMIASVTRMATATASRNLRSRSRNSPTITALKLEELLWLTPSQTVSRSEDSSSRCCS